MWKKVCFKCKKKSYSAARIGTKWICPYCKEDLTKVKAENLTEEDLHGKLWP